jgi:biopolymer transport protein ExbD
MPVIAPGRRPAFPPIGRLRTSPLTGGKKNLLMPLNLTAMVDMFTTIVIFLLQSFSSSGDLLLVQKGIKLPEAKKAAVLGERGPVVTLFQNQVIFDGNPVAALAELSDDENGIEIVTETLKGIREREEQAKGRDVNKVFDGFVIIQADATTDFKLVRKVVWSLNQAGWAKIKFIVLGKSDGKAPAAE